MYFNVEKCKVMSISKAHCYLKFEYYVDNHDGLRSHIVYQYDF